MTKNILLLENLSLEKIQRLKELAPNYQLVKEITEKNKEDIEIVLGWNEAVKNLIESDSSNVKWIQYIYAGVNHLPLNLFKRKNIQLSSGSGANAGAVAESTMGAILGISRNIIQAVKEQEKRNWFIPEKNMELKDKNIVIVGAGKIGEEIGRLAQAFQMNRIGINRSGRKINYMNEQYTQGELIDLIHRGDFIINILPVTDQTRDFFDEKLFSKMKESAIFINVGRGETVLMEDLIDSLDNEEIAGAVLDVFEEEPLARNHPLWGYENVLITPHIAGDVESQMDHLFPIFIDNLSAYLKENTLAHNEIDLEHGY